MGAPGSAERPLSALVVGAGFGGICMGIALRRAGIEDFEVLERGEDVGGVWRENTYPGAACDVRSHLYSFSFDPNPRWSRRYAPQAEILDYLRGCARRHGLAPHLRLRTEVVRADFDEPAGLWRVESAGGELRHARHLVVSTGQLDRPAVPALRGLASFEGPAFHSARWRHDVDLTGRRVAVVGTGASAIQLVPEIAPRVQRLHVFQRSAPYVMPKDDRGYAPWRQRLFARAPALARARRWADYWAHESRVLAFVHARWLMRIAERSFRRHLETEVPDPELRAKLVPDYPMGCKRILISNDWYSTLMRPDVELVADAIAEVRPRSIVDARGVERELDAIVFGTGFRATEMVAPMEVRGLGGRALREAWRDGAEAYLGIVVAGFPNLFLLYGPNTNLGHNSIVFMIESQVRYAMQAIRAARARRLRYLDVLAERQREFVAAVDERARDTVWAGACTSWYKTESGRNTSNWPGFTFSYRRRTSRLELADFRLAS